MSQVVMNGSGESEHTRCFSLMSVVMLHHTIYRNSRADQNGDNLSL